MRYDCLCGCGKIAHKRGLNNVCYDKVRKRIRLGKTTWEKEIKNGRALPVKDKNKYVQHLFKKA